MHSEPLAHMYIADHGESSIVTHMQSIGKQYDCDFMHFRPMDLYASYLNVLE